MHKPLHETPISIPELGSPGSFGYKRSTYRHEGVDLYCPEGEFVLAMEAGTVVGVSIFTGENASPPTPHWNQTWSVMVEGESGVIGYCEVKPMFYIQPGYLLEPGYPIGKIIPVLKKDKGNGTSMLHLSLYKSGTTENVDWKLDEPQPENLLDSTELLRKLL